MKTIIHRSNERGFANHGWLVSYHSFSFASFYDPKKMGFGLLRVLNDDRVMGGKGFGTHAHQNMEIVSIPLSGALLHKDSTGHEAVIRSGEVQIMSAGKGIAHSEFNASESEEVNFLQIWVLPKEKNIEPRYEQKLITHNGSANHELGSTIKTIVSPDDQADGVRINQDAYFSLGSLKSNNGLIYSLNSHNNGVYIFVIDGEVVIGDEVLRKRDAIGIWEASSVALNSTLASTVLFIEVPMMEEH